MESIKPSLLKYLANFSKSPSSEYDIEVIHVLISNEVKDNRAEQKISLNGLNTKRLTYKINYYL